MAIKSTVDKSILYYTDNRLGEPIMTAVQECILDSGLPIVSVSLKPIDFGKNISVEMSPSVITLYSQIMIGLDALTTPVVFFCEHDVMYHKSHFDFYPDRMNVYYYNTNVWRWDYPYDRFISFDGLRSVSGLCAGLELLRNHYRVRLDLIRREGWEDSRNPKWARKIGHEPGKPKRIGGFMDEEIAEWKSPFPNIDIRHNGTMTPRKVTLDSFVRKPTGWKEVTSNGIDGWSFGTLELKHS